MVAHPTKCLGPPSRLPFVEQGIYDKAAAVMLATREERPYKPLVN
jgi:hypothetical protein